MSSTVSSFRNAAPSPGRATTHVEAMLVGFKDEDIVLDYERMKETLAWYRRNVVEGLATYNLTQSRVFENLLAPLEQKRLDISTYCALLDIPQRSPRSMDATLKLREPAVLGLRDIQRDLNRLQQRVMEYVVNDLFQDLNRLSNTWMGLSRLQPQAPADFDLTKYFDAVKRTYNAYGASGDVLTTARFVAHDSFPEIFGRTDDGKSKLAHLYTLSRISPYPRFARAKARAGAVLGRWRIGRMRAAAP